jgi:type I restriction enzyme M protein
MAAKKKAAKGVKKASGANVGFEAQLWAAANALWGSMDAAEYKHVALGLIFLKYISDAFEEQHARLVAEEAQGADPENDWRGELLKDDQRSAYGTPPAGNPNYAWRTAG